MITTLQHFQHFRGRTLRNCFRLRMSYKDNVPIPTFGGHLLQKYSRQGLPLQYSTLQDSYQAIGMKIAQSASIIPLLWYQYCKQASTIPITRQVYCISKHRASCKLSEKIDQKAQTLHHCKTHTAINTVLQTPSQNARIKPKPIIKP